MISINYTVFMWIYIQNIYSWKQWRITIEANEAEASSLNQNQGLSMLSQMSIDRNIFRELSFSDIIHDFASQKAKKEILGCSLT